jgi:adenosyl cobinamide kinase/adenosyl cobinamide phosphate guanylyltransferase
LITLVLGGARSGKSVVAERLAAGLPGPVTYVATAIATATGTSDADDPDMAARIAAHQARRPSTWATVEAGGHLGAVLADVAGTVLVDSLGTWLAACPDFQVDMAALSVALTGRVGNTILVSEEVGLGVHPSSGAGRRFRDALGEVNQEVAAIADEVLLVVAGRILRLDELSARP